MKNAILVKWRLVTQYDFDNLMYGQLLPFKMPKDRLKIHQTEHLAQSKEAHLVFDMALKIGRDLRLKTDRTMVISGEPWPANGEVASVDPNKRLMTSQIQKIFFVEGVPHVITENDSCYRLVGEPQDKNEYPYLKEYFEEYYKPWIAGVLITEQTIRQFEERIGSHFEPYNPD